MRWLLVSTALVLAGCGSGGDSDSSSSSSNDKACIITFAGNELCGDSGKAWCEQFADRVSGDAETISACAAVGADFAVAPTDTPEDRREEKAGEIRSVLEGKYPKLAPSTLVEGRIIAIDLNEGQASAPPATRSQRRRVCASARAAAFGQTPITVGDVNSSDEPTKCE